MSFNALSLLMKRGAKLISQCAKIWVDACTSRISRDEWQSQNWAEICLSRLNYKWDKLPKWNRVSRQLRSINRWSGISFCNWETICCSNVWGLCRELSSWILLSANQRLIWSASRRFHQVRNERKTHKVHLPYPTCYWRWQCPSPWQLAKLPCIAR